MTEATSDHVVVRPPRAQRADVWPYVERRRSIRLANPHPMRRASDLRALEAEHQTVEATQRSPLLTILRDVAKHWRLALPIAAALVEIVAGLAGATAGNLSSDPGSATVSRLVEGPVGLIVLPAVWLLCVYLTRALEQRFVCNGTEESKRVLHAAGLLVVVLTFANYATESDLARGYVLFSTATATFVSLSGRWGLRVLLRRARAQGRCTIRTVLAGPAGAVRVLAERLARETGSGLDVIGVCVPDDERALLSSTPVRVLGSLNQVQAVVQATDAGAVAVCACPDMQGAALRELAWQLEGGGVQLFVAPGLLDVTGPRLHIRPVGGLPMLHVEEPELSGGRRLVKAVIDATLAIGALTFLALPMLVIAVAVRLTSSGPAVYRQTRVGRDGRLFTVLKFRSMYLDADERLAELADKNERAEGLLFKMRDDPRVTPVGKWLRKYSLDELPQLINVARGEMSLVGPRPPLPTEVERYGYGVSRRLLVKPGLTGLWQVSGRSDLTWDESVTLDLRYVENWSLMLDLSILLKTAKAVLRTSGAY